MSALVGKKIIVNVCFGWNGIAVPLLVKGENSLYYLCETMTNAKCNVTIDKIAIENGLFEIEEM